VEKQMTTQDIAAAIERAQTVLMRRPDMGLHDDMPGIARWQGGVSTVASHVNGAQMVTDMPTELGGSGEHVSPGWLVRAGLAACTVTTIAMIAAAEGIALDSLEVRADSRSDARGLLRLAGDDGKPCYPGPLDVRMVVRIAAAGVPAERLRALVDTAQRCSPMGSAIEQAVPVALRVEVLDA
jgi:uncharacterized OsmC-like protein